MAGICKNSFFDSINFIFLFPAFFTSHYYTFQITDEIRPNFFKVNYFASSKFSMLCADRLTNFANSKAIIEENLKKKINGYEKAVREYFVAAENHSARK